MSYDKISAKRFLDEYTRYTVAVPTWFNFASEISSLMFECWRLKNMVITCMPPFLFKKWTLAVVLILFVLMWDISSRFIYFSYMMCWNYKCSSNCVRKFICSKGNLTRNKQTQDLIRRSNTRVRMHKRKVCLLNLAKNLNLSRFNILVKDFKL